MVDLWRACTARNPSARPSAADVQAALSDLQSVPRPAAPPTAHSAPDPPAAVSAGHGTLQAAERGMGTPCLGDEQAAKAWAEAVIAEQPANGEHAGGSCLEVEAAAIVAAGSSALTPSLKKLAE